MEERSYALLAFYAYSVSIRLTAAITSTPAECIRCHRGELPASPLTEDIDSAARDPKQLLDDELEIRDSHSHILPRHHAARTHMTL
jgi:hypothetical protein